MDTLILATGNRHKAEEIQESLKGMGLTLRTLKDFPDCPAVEEDGKTCQDNAIKKATAIAAYTGQWALADDTGLEVDALDGRPGVYAARYAGEQATYEDNCRKLLQELEGVPGDKRTARFLTVMALSDPQGNTQVVEGVLQGVITTSFQGTQGFGYDPVFFVPEENKTLADMTLTEKNQISHRALALQKTKALLATYQQTG